MRRFIRLLCIKFYFYSKIKFVDMTKKALRLKALYIPYYSQTFYYAAKLVNFDICMKLLHRESLES